jgi:hypothetical protein
VLVESTAGVGALATALKECKKELPGRDSSTASRLKRSLRNGDKSCELNEKIKIFVMKNRNNDTCPWRIITLWVVC